MLRRATSQVYGPFNDQAPALLSSAEIVPFNGTPAYVIAAPTWDAHAAYLVILMARGLGCITSSWML